MERSIIYSLKVWLLTILLGPVIYYLILSFTDPVFRHYTNLFNFTTEVLRYSIIFSLPSLVLFTLLAFLINLPNYSMWIKKLILNVIGVLLIALPLHAIKSYWGPWVIQWTIAYGSIIIVGIWIFKLEQTSSLEV
jgi:hypothetical protein